MPEQQTKRKEEKILQSDGNREEKKANNPRDEKSKIQFRRTKLIKQKENPAKVDAHTCIHA